MPGGDRRQVIKVDSRFQVIQEVANNIFSLIHVVGFQIRCLAVDWKSPYLENFLPLHRSSLMEFRVLTYSRKLLSVMAGDHVRLPGVVDVPKYRLLFAAYVGNVNTTRVERAAWRRTGRIGHVTFKHNSLSIRFNVRIRHWYG